jgi:hypothetical protein
VRSPAAGGEDRVARARRASGRELLRLLMGANEDVLRAALSNPRLEELHLVELARSRRVVNSEFFRVLMQHPLAATSYRVKVAVVRNPRAPKSLVLSLVKYLLRKDLALVARDVNIAPAVRTLAEHHLRLRMEDLTVGEKIELAREATPPLLRILLKDPDPRVVRAALMNFRLREVELLSMVNDRSARPESLREVALSSRWGTHYQVRLALVRNPATPFELRLELLDELMFPDLLGIVETPHQPPEILHPARIRLRAKLAALSRSEREALLQGGSPALAALVLEEPDEEFILGVIRKLRLPRGMIMHLARRCQLPRVLLAMSVHPVWQTDRDIVALLNANPFLPFGVEMPPPAARDRLRQVTDGEGDE